MTIQKEHNKNHNLFLQENDKLVYQEVTTSLYRVACPIHSFTVKIIVTIAVPDRFHCNIGGFIVPLCLKG